MNFVLVLLLIFIAYTFYTSFEKLSNTPTETFATKLVNLLQSSNNSYVNYLTFLNDQKTPHVKLFSTDVYNNFMNGIKEGTLTVDKLDLISNFIN